MYTLVNVITGESRGSFKSRDAAEVEKKSYGPMTVVWTIKELENEEIN